MATFAPSEYELAALTRMFDLAEGFGGGAQRARALLCAWWNATELGGFDLADLWSFDDANREAAIAVIQLIGRSPVGTYADAIEGFGDRMRALAARHAAVRGQG
jgi:hypothetical protein